MADEITRERDATRHQAFLYLGINPNQPRFFSQQVQMVGKEADLLGLPVDLSHATELQDPDDGTPRFIAGVSLLDGDDLL